MGLKTRLDNLVDNTLDKASYSFNIYNPEGLSLKDGEYTGIINQGTEPYIKPLPVVNIGMPDSFVRGGLLTAVQRRAEDTVRIGKFLISPKGLIFTAKQIALQQSNPKINKPHRGIQLKSSSNQRQYLPLNNLISVGLGSTESGIFTKREGILPNKQGYVDDISDISDSKLNIKPTKNTKNRLIHLTKNNISTVRIVYDDLFSIRKKFLSNQLTDLYNYTGGPNSIFGIGKTNIGPSGTRSITNKEGLPTIPLSLPEKSSNQKVDNFLTAYLGDKKGWGTDYKPLSADKTNEISLHRESRVQLGNPGAGITPGLSTRDSHITKVAKVNDFNRHILNTYDGGRIDKINYLDIQKDQTGTTKSEYNDLINFRFEAVNTDDMNKSDVMVFRAFLDSFDDSYTATHNEFEYNGRAEKFYTYKSFDRKISLSFKVAAQTRWEMMPLYKKLNYLVSNTAPEYKYNRIRTPFMRLTVGDWCSRLPGLLSNVSLKWQKDYPWEISVGGGSDNLGTDGKKLTGDNHMLILPHVLDVSVNYIPIHNFLPEKSSKSPFILPDNNNKVGTINPNQKWLEKSIDDIKSEINVNNDTEKNY